MQRGRERGLWGTGKGMPQTKEGAYRSAGTAAPVQAGSWDELPTDAGARCRRVHLLDERQHKRKGGQPKHRGDDGKQLAGEARLAGWQVLPAGKQASRKACTSHSSPSKRGAPLPNGKAPQSRHHSWARSNQSAAHPPCHQAQAEQHGYEIHAVLPTPAQQRRASSPHPSTTASTSYRLYQT